MDEVYSPRTLLRYSVGFHLTPDPLVLGSNSTLLEATSQSRAYGQLTFVRRPYDFQGIISLMLIWMGVLFDCLCDERQLLGRIFSSTQNSKMSLSLSPNIH